MATVLDQGIKGFKATKRLASERKMRGLSQADLARQLHTYPPSISRWENGISIMRPGTARKVARVLGMSMEQAIKDRVFRAVKR